MADQQGLEVNIPDAGELTQSMANIAERSQRIVTEFLSRQGAEGALGMGDPLNIGSAFIEMTTKMMTDPAKMMEAQMTLWQDYLSLWQNTAARMMGQATDDVVIPERGDKRFKDDAWNENEVFNYVKQSYLLTARWMQSTINNVEGLDDQTQQKVDFYSRQFINALSPTNFVMTNPEVLRTTMETGGENLVNGLENMLADLERGQGNLKISMTDEDAFTVGENIAMTPGDVVYRNELMELIQYTPTTEKVDSIPLLIIPPWINKFYILDLRAKNSFIKWAVDQGHTVFTISWVNPDEKLATKQFEDYMLEGPVDALRVVKEITGEKKVNTIGYCIGGTLQACTLAYLAAKKDDSVASATYFTTMIDFEDPGELSVFIDEDQISALEDRMNERGYLEGSEMAGTFNMMRDNDLIWSFVVNNYLLGKDPFPFDLLYWNQDNTRMPAAMHSYYLRNMYLNNKVIEKGGLTLGGVPIDITKIKVPSYLVAAREDHIAPWTSCFAPTQLYTGDIKFVLSASGHIAGIINPPAANKYCYWTNDKKAKTPEKWLEGAVQHEGSWWHDWDEWAKSQPTNKPIAKRIPGKGKKPEYKALCPAPGEYVRMK